MIFVYLCYFQQFHEQITLMENELVYVSRYVSIKFTMISSTLIITMTFLCE